MDDPLLVVLALGGPYALGFLLRLKGAFLAAIALAVGSATAAGTGVADGQLVGALLLGGAAGFALGWAGSLTRRLLR